MKLAIVHDWIITVGGAERVLFTLHTLWPDAPIYMLIYKKSTIQRWLPRATIITSKLQQVPWAWKWYTLLAPFMPSAIESFDLSAYDTVISSSVLFSKGIIVRPGTRHICYCYSPARPLWDRTTSYERTGILSRLYRHFMRAWDYAAAQRPDQLIAISQTIANRIQKYYRRDSIVIPPPTRCINSEEKVKPFLEKRLNLFEDYYLIVARMVPHKTLDIVLQAFTKLRDKLVIVGDGPLRKKLMRYASPNVTFTGWVSDKQLDKLYAQCRSVIVPNEEDWGLTAIEAMAHGKPVLALRKGGATETVIEGVTGEFFDDPIPEALADGIRRLRENYDSYDTEYIRKHAAQYGSEQFATRMHAIIEQSL